MCKGAVGYDGPTGVGTPKGIAALAAAAASTPRRRRRRSTPALGHRPTTRPRASASPARPGRHLRMPDRRRRLRRLHLALHRRHALRRRPHLRGPRHGRSGNVDPTPASRSFTVDTTPPQTTIDSGPAGPTNDSTPTFGFSSSEPAPPSNAEWTPPPSPAAPRPSPATRSPTGPTSSRSAPRMESSNVDPTPASAQLHRRHHAPADDDRLRPPAWPDQRLDAQLRLLERAGRQLPMPDRRRRLRRLHLSLHRRPALRRRPQLRSPRHRRSGNVDPTPASRSFTVDTTPPADDDRLRPGRDHQRLDANLRLLRRGRLHLRMPSGRRRLRRLRLALHQQRALRRSPHFEVRATDAATNVDPTPAQRSFTVDTTPPQTTIDSGPEGPTNDSTPSFTFSADEAGSTFQCRVDSATFTPCSSPYTAASLADGAHSFEVRATDGAGNVDPTPASRSFDVDTTAEPGVTLPETTLPERLPQKLLRCSNPKSFRARRSHRPRSPSASTASSTASGRTTKLTVSVPGPGTLVLFGRKVRKVTRKTTTGGSVSVPVEPKQRFRNGALGPGRTKVYVTYTPLGGAPVTRALCAQAELGAAAWATEVIASTVALARPRTTTVSRAE